MKTCCGRGFATDEAFGGHATSVHAGSIPIQIQGDTAEKAARYAVWDMADVVGYVEWARTFSKEKRDTLAKSGDAMSDGSFPIANLKDLKNAIRAVGRASDPAAAKAHIKKRAKALNQSGLIPDDWSAESAGLVPPVDVDGRRNTPITNPTMDQDPALLPYKCPFCGRRFEEKVAEALHEDLVHQDQLRAVEHPDGKFQTKNSGDASKLILADGKKVKVQTEWADTVAAPSAGPADVDDCPVAGCDFTGLPSAMVTHLGSPAHDQVDPALIEHYKRKKKATEEADQADRPDSFNDIQAAVQDAISDMFVDPLNPDRYCYIWIADISDSWVVFEVRSDYYKINYSMDDSGKVTLSGPLTAVQRRTVYVPDPDGDNSED